MDCCRHLKKARQAFLNGGNILNRHPMLSSVYLCSNWQVIEVGHNSLNIVPPGTATDGSYCTVLSSKQDLKAIHKQQEDEQTSLGKQDLLRVLPCVISRSYRIGDTPRWLRTGPLGLVITDWLAFSNGKQISNVIISIIIVINDLGCRQKTLKKTVTFFSSSQRQMACLTTPYSFIRKAWPNFTAG